MTEPSVATTETATTTPDTTVTNTPASDDDVIDPIPWHFKLLLGAIALYLGYRAFQGIEWLAGLL